MIETEGTQAAPAPEAPPEQPKKRRQKKRDMMRIEALEKLMQETGGDVDPDTIVSMYFPHRRRKLLAAALLRLDKLWLWFLGLIVLVAVLFLLAFSQEKMFRKGIAIDYDPNFSAPTARLYADTVLDATNISIDDIPSDVDDINGSHNGENYMAYTYYVRNAGKEDLNYVASIKLVSASKGAEEALRVAVWRNGKCTVYAMPSSGGEPEAGCVNFESREVVCSFAESDFLVGYVDKYTIVIWLEGSDPECVDKIVGGSVELSMDIDSKEHSDTSLLQKFIADIRDTLTDSKPISASGNDAPDYYESGEVTWFNRRNQDNEP